MVCLQQQRMNDFDKWWMRFVYVALRIRLISTKGDFLDDHLARPLSRFLYLISGISAPAPQSLYENVPFCFSCRIICHELFYFHVLLFFGKPETSLGNRPPPLFVERGGHPSIKCWANNLLILLFTFHNFSFQVFFLPQYSVGLWEFLQVAVSKRLQSIIIRNK